MSTSEPKLSSSSSEATVGELLTRLSEQTSRLVRDELYLARAELKTTAKRGGLGAGLFSAAGLLALFGIAVLVATAIIALALVLPWWAAGLIVAGVLLAAAGIAAMIARNQVKQAGQATRHPVDNVKRDVQEIKEARRNDDADKP